MNSEKDYIYEVETEVALLNEDSVLKPYAYQSLFAQIADQHLNKIDKNVDMTMKYNLAWALISLSTEIVNPIKGCMKLYANTWYSERRGPFFRRDFVFKNTDGNVMFRGATFSVLLDIEKRTIYRQKEIPFLFDEPIADFTIKASPIGKIHADFTKIEERKVFNSYIDCLGHVNNCRYGEFGYDAFTDEECQNLDKLKRMDIYFLSELRKQDTFSILKAYDTNKILVRGHNNEKEKTAFDIVMDFAE